MKLLTPREREILLAYVEYETMQTVADELGLAHSTVRNALHTAYGKLDTTNVLGALKALHWLRPPR